MIISKFPFSSVCMHSSSFISLSLSLSLSHIHTHTHRFGPANTRLMQAYSQFDDRFALLVPFVRLWVKHIGSRHSSSGRYRFNLTSYGVSLMLIYSLQHCTPPVLPCLQSPGAWPKNMDRFSKDGFLQQQKQLLQQYPQLTVGPWLCDFVPPDSLQPSTNTQTPGTITVGTVDRVLMSFGCLLIFSPKDLS